MFPVLLTFYIQGVLKLNDVVVTLHTVVLPLSADRPTVTLLPKTSGLSFTKGRSLNTSHRRKPQYTREFLILFHMSAPCFDQYRSSTR